MSRKRPIFEVNDYNNNFDIETTKKKPRLNIKSEDVGIISIRETTLPCYQLTTKSQPKDEGESTANNDLCFVLSEPENTENRTTNKIPIKNSTISTDGSECCDYDDDILVTISNDIKSKDETDARYAGEIVWAHLTGYRFWPGIIFNYENEGTFRKNVVIVARHCFACEADDHVNVKFLCSGKYNSVREKSAILPYRGLNAFRSARGFPANRGNKAYQTDSKKNWIQAIRVANVLLCVKPEIRVDFYDTILLKAVNHIKRDKERSDTTDTVDTAYSSLCPSSNGDLAYKLNIFFNSLRNQNQCQQTADNSVRGRLAKFVLDRLCDDETSMNRNVISNETKFYVHLYALSSHIMDVKQNGKPSKDVILGNLPSTLPQPTTTRQKDIAKNKDENKESLEAEKQKKLAAELSTNKKKPTNEGIEQKKCEINNYILSCHMEGKPDNFLLKGLPKNPVCHCCLDGGEVMKCSGQCCAHFHEHCLGKEIKVSDYNNILRQKMSKTGQDNSRRNVTVVKNKEKLKCMSCNSLQANKCFVCAKSDEDCIQCCQKNCGKAYHFECLKNYDTKDPIYKGQKIVGLYCPRHICHTCVSDDKTNRQNVERNEDLIKCLLCPSTYHRSSKCIPAGSELVSVTQLTCARHAAKKPSVHIDFCFFCGENGGNGQLIRCATCVNAFHAACIYKEMGDPFVCKVCDSGRRPLNGEIVWCKYGIHSWWPAVIIPPPLISDDVLSKKSKPNQICVYFFETHNHGWVSDAQIYLYSIEDKRNESDSKTLGMAIDEAGHWMARFQEINDKCAKSPVKVQPQYVKCKTLKIESRLLKKFKDDEYSRCNCRPIDEAPCTDENNCENIRLKYECVPELCPAKDRCHNQHFQRGEQFKFQVKMTEGKGWGFFAVEDIPANRFLIEYKGEVIDRVEQYQRFNRAIARKDDHFYFMKLGNKGFYIDGKECGNDARFINHSCEPNAELQEWIVHSNGYELIRIGFFSLRTIVSGEEITFDYNWEKIIGNEYAKCQCGASKCRGSIYKK